MCAEESPSHDVSGYRCGDASAPHTHEYLLPEVLDILDSFDFPGEENKVLDLGCGSGAATARLSACGYQTVGIDPSERGIEEAKGAYPNLDFYVGSVYEDLVGKFGQFPAVVSLEVIEHVYAPRRYAECVHNLLTEGGVAVISTPYHGYWKNLAIALLGKTDEHYDPLWDHGHIKFWSMDTLRTLLEEQGFRDISFRRVGRVPPLAKSMIAVARK